jgi:Domain of unknown function (DUF1902)
VTARIVRVKYDGGDAGLFFATSPDLRGLLVAKRTMDELVEAVPRPSGNSTPRTAST